MDYRSFQSLLVTASSLALVQHAIYFMSLCSESQAIIFFYIQVSEKVIAMTQTLEYNQKCTGVI